MLGYCLIVSAIKLGYLLSIKPYGIFIQLYFKLGITILFVYRTIDEPLFVTILFSFISFIILIAVPHSIHLSFNLLATPNRLAYFKVSAIINFLAAKILLKCAFIVHTSTIICLTNG